MTETPVAGGALEAHAGGETPRDPSAAVAVDEALPAREGKILTRGYDYLDVDHDTVQRVRSLAERIRDRHNQYQLQTGRDLAEVQEALGHGRFGAWLAAEFGWTERAARYFMNAARLVDSKPEIVSVLPITAIYHLSAPSLSEQIRGGIIARVENGEPMSVKDVKAAIDQGKQQEAAELAEQKQLARRAKMTPDELPREKGRQRSREQKAAERQRQKEEWQQRAAEADKAADEIVILLTDRLGQDGMERLRSLMAKASWWQIAARLERAP